MIRKLTLVAGFAAGYVLGAKAGTQRYEQIVAKARELAGQPAVQEVRSTLAETASQLGENAKDTVNETVAAVGDKVTGDDVVDLTPAAKPRTRTRTAATPLPATEV